MGVEELIKKGQFSRILEEIVGADCQDEALSLVAQKLELIADVLDVYREEGDFPETPRLARLFTEYGGVVYLERPWKPDKGENAKKVSENVAYAMVRRAAELDAPSLPAVVLKEFLEEKRGGQAFVTRNELMGAYGALREAWQEHDTREYQRLFPSFAYHPGIAFDPDASKETRLAQLAAFTGTVAARKGWKFWKTETVDLTKKEIMEFLSVVREYDTSAEVRRLAEEKVRLMARFHTLHPRRNGYALG